MHGGIEPEFVGSAAIYKVLVQYPVTIENRYIFPGLILNKVNKIPGKIRSDTKSADITAKYQVPFVCHLPQPSPAYKRVNPALALIDTGRGPGKSSSTSMEE